jgi:4-diphosphocytidyl-2-C-methyl-D-erythritol kinase
MLLSETATKIATETAYAKINLALHVRRKRADGYHEIDTIFAFVDSGDEITGELADSLELTVTGPFAGVLSNDADNLVLKTARLMQGHFDVTQGAKLHLQKNLPVASGIGGGSADAAATARLLNKLWNINATSDELEALTGVLGADIPACVKSVTARGLGTGTSLEAIDGHAAAGMPVLLINPRQPVSTGPVFAAWDGKDRGAIAGDDLMEMVRNGRNDLEDPAISICPEIAQILKILEAHDPILSRMSGSGATCFALFDSIEARDRAGQAITSEHPEYWIMAGLLR